MTITTFYACDRILELRSILEIILLESDVEAEDAETQASICPVSHSLAHSSAPSHRHRLSQNYLAETFAAVCSCRSKWTEYLKVQAQL